VRRGLLLLLIVLTAASPARAADATARQEVLVGLEAPPLALAVAQSRALTVAARRSRADLASATSNSYLATIGAQQQTLERRIQRRIAGARVVRRYGVVLNGLAVSLAPADVPKLTRLRGVATVYPSATYHAQADFHTIGAETLWGPSFATAGSGVKIAILDDGIDASHAFFRPTGFSPPPGFPKGTRALTTGKVIVARAFAPRGVSWRYARRPFDPVESAHGTHVAGIAAGNYGIFSTASSSPLAGTAPRAYLGNYKVLTVPTASGVGLDGNAPEIVAGIEAAVKDGMDVINLSIGEPETEPGRDAVVAALNGAAAAGVVPVVAAGNDFGEFGFGTVASPATAARAITVGASGPRGVMGFSAAGPTALSHRMKPDVVAPGSEILSSVPRRFGTWTELEGTSMAAPHVAGGVALLRQRHPSWTPAQIASALVTTARSVLDDGRPASPLRAGGGRVDLAAADRPLLFAAPRAVSFGLLRRGATARRRIALTDAGDGAGAWAVRLTGSGDADAAITVPQTAVVPGTLDLTATVPPGAREGDRSGYVVLERAGIVRRIPYWVGVTVPTLATSGARTLARSGTYSGTTARQPSRVTRYRYPDRFAGAPPVLAGPERVFRVRLRRRVANLGVAIVHRARGVRVEPRIVFGSDESRLTGYAALPFVLNPYLDSLFERSLVAGAVHPTPGVYHVVFDTRSPRTAGRFTFRFWIDDRARPRLRLLTPTIRPGGTIVFAATDRGAGVDPASIRITFDGRRVRGTLTRGRLRIRSDEFARGRYRIIVRVSDYQETRNDENVGAILPNTRRLATTVVVR